MVTRRASGSEILERRRKPPNPPETICAHGLFSFLKHSQGTLCPSDNLSEMPVCSKFCLFAILGEFVHNLG